MIPAEVEKKKAKVSNDAYVSWTKARAQSDFSIFSPLLEEAFDVAKEVAVLRMDEGESKVYDKMLDDFEKGLPAKRIDEIFAEIEKTLPPLITSVLASSTPPDTAPLHGTFPLSKQEPFNKKIVDRLGFSGRTDVSVHPFTTSFSSSDVRITSRFSETEWYQGLAGSIHETGHALYESNLDTSPHHINSALSMGTHESQSLFWEVRFGRGAKDGWNEATTNTIILDYNTNRSPPPRSAMSVCHDHSGRSRDLSSGSRSTETRATTQYSRPLTR